MASAHHELLKASSEAQKLLRADFHSISLALPRESPTHLRIIHSTDERAKRILGLEFPVTKGIAGWVYREQQPSIKNPQDQNAIHFDGVDMFAGTNTGDGAILTLPLTLDGRCRAVIQFIKTGGGRFEETDLQLAMPFLPALTKFVVAVDATKDADTVTRIS